MEHGSELYVVRGLGFLRGTADIESVAVDTRGGTPIRISDLGKVTIGNAVRLGRVGRTDTEVKGYPARIRDEDDVAEGIVIMRRGENPVEVCERVKKMAEEINAHYLPAGVKLVTYDDRTALVDRTLHTVRHNVIEGIGLVLLVLFMFLGLGTGAQPLSWRLRFRWRFSGHSCCWISAGCRQT